MRIESPSFTIDDLRSFMDTYGTRERDLLADRLQRASERLAELGPLVKVEAGSDGEWNAHELLAHLAVLSKFYGVLVHRVASGKPPDMDLLQAVNMRDQAGQQMAQLDPQELLRMTLADQERTIKTLRSTSPEALHRRADFDGITMTAEEIARMPLISHLEIHIDDLEKMLSR